MNQPASPTVEWREYADPVSGVRVQQLTNYKGHSHHFYFTNPGWHDGGRRLLFGSDRENRTNLFSIELATGAIRQVTDLAEDGVFLHACVNPAREECYFAAASGLWAADLETGRARLLWKRADGFMLSMVNCTADGRWVCFGIFEDLSARIRIDYLHRYIGFRETWQARPLSRILRVPAGGGPAEVVHEDRTWIGHINTSPTQPHLLTFCHEGPWVDVDNRIWGLDLVSSKVWPIRPRKMEKERIGHEYWHADGVHLGYHGTRPDGSKLFGRIRSDNADEFETAFPFLTGHIHSLDFNLIVGDGGKVIRLWQWNGRSFDGPRALCEHRSSMNLQHAHPHPRLRADGRAVVFTTDATGYCNVYQVEIPAFASLPEVKD